MTNAFFDAATMFIKIGYKAVNDTLKEQSDTLIRVIELLDQAKKNHKFVHTVGMGRSGLVGRFFGELLKLKGIRTSTIGDILAKPVNRGDLVFAFSGSGWTRTTTLYSELSLQRDAILIALTAGKKSKLDRLADLTIYVPGKPILSEVDYIARKITGKYKTPLAPMGSIPEFSALLISTGLALAVDEKNPIEAFKQNLLYILSYAEKAIKQIYSQQKENLEAIFKVYEHTIKTQACIYFAGAGLLSHIANMVAMRFQHLGANVCSLSDWVFRSKKDILTIISASGKASIPLILAREAKKKNMTVISLTTDLSSEISLLSSIRIILPRVSDRINYFELGIQENTQYTPTFEITTFIIFEAIVAELANRFNITEETMQTLHANIE